MKNFRYNYKEMVTKVEEQTAEVPQVERGFLKYKESGGKLSEKSYNTLMKQVKKTDIYETNTHSIYQAKSMAFDDNIMIEDSSIVIYDILRRGSLEKVSSDFRKFKSLSDQEVFAETLLLENKIDEYNRFIYLHPHIFENKVRK